MPDLAGFTRELKAGHQRALGAAVKGEAYRLMRATQASLRAGVGPERAGLTRLAGKTKGRPALGMFAAAVAYEVRRGVGQWLAEVGLATESGLRKRPLPLPMLRAVVAGAFDRPITREDQRRIAARLRKRGYGDRLDRRGRRVRGAPIPRVGTVIRWPERDYVTPLVEAEVRHSQANVAMLYARAQRGERWARTWWATAGAGAKPSAKGWAR